jgi:hypothetical protein
MNYSILSMGLASYKVSGFGVSCDCKSKLNPEGYLFNPGSFTLDGVVDSVRGCRDAIILEYDCPSLNEIVHFDGRTVCLVPPSSVSSSVFVLNRLESEYSYFPREGFADYQSVMDSRTGARISCTTAYLFKKAFNEYNNPEKCEAQRMTEEYELLQQANEMGFRSIDEAIQYTVPYVPDSLRAIASHLELFNSSETILSLRPMHFCYRRNDDQISYPDLQGLSS